MNVVEGGIAKTNAHPKTDRLWDRPWTSYELFKYHLNLHFPPSRSFIRMLSEYATDVEEKKMLLSICSKQGLSVYRTLAGQRPTLMDVLASFPSVSPPLSVLLDNLHRLQPRFYSIANSPLSSESSQSVVRIAFNIVDFECTIATEQTKRFQGLCTVWLEGLTSSLLARDIPLFPKLEHSFRLNTSLRTPVILVAGGTGIAPFIGFLQHLQKTLDNPREDITVMLIYGHRDKSDVLYATEIDSFVQSGLVNVYIECLSRQDQPKDSEQVKYVQDGIAKEENKIWEWIDGQEGRVYVCGSVGLGSSVNGALLRVMQGKKQVTDKEAFEWLTVLASEKRLLRDLW